MKTQSEKAQSFWDLHQSGTFVLPNAWDAGSAKWLEQAGAVALGTTSAGFAWASGLKDGAQTRDMAVANAERIAGGTDLPVTADFLNGFGAEPEDAAEAVRLAHEAGCVGCSIEDTTGDTERPLYDIELATERIAAASEAANALPDPFVLCARADVLFAGAGDIDDVIARLRAFEKVGAPLLYAPVLVSLEEVDQVLNAVEASVNVLVGIGQSYTIDDLMVRGVRRVSVGHSLYSAAMGELNRAARDLIDHGSLDWSGNALGYSALQETMHDA